MSTTSLSFFFRFVGAFSAGFVPRRFTMAARIRAAAGATSSEEEGRLVSVDGRPDLEEEAGEERWWKAAGPDGRLG